MPESTNAKLTGLLFAMKRDLMSKFKEGKGFCPVDYFRAEILSYLQSHKKTKMKDVANFLGITPPSATSLVDKLVQEKFLERQNDKTDRRKVLLLITKKGSLFIKKTYTEMNDIMQKTFRSLNDKDKKDLIRIYNKLLKK